MDIKLSKVNFEIVEAHYLNRLQVIAPLAKERKKNEHILFLHYINDLIMESLRYLQNIYANDDKVYECTSKHIDDKCLAADLSFDLSLTDQ